MDTYNEVIVVTEWKPTDCRLVAREVLLKF